MIKFYENGKIKNKTIIFNLLLLISLIFFSACTIYPAPPNNITGNGNIQVYSEPAGASIYLNGSSTGYTSPKLLKNVSAESYLVTLKLEGYLDSNNFVQVYPNQTAQLNVSLALNPYIDPPNMNLLAKIEVEPNNLNLLTGQSTKINSITAFYADGSSKKLLASQCNIYSTDPNVVSVTSEGNITAISEGQANIWVEYQEINIIKSAKIMINVLNSSEDLGNLTSISVLPSTMSLSVGESKSISSITAYYDNGIEQQIDPGHCNFLIDNTNISISNSGVITGNYIGNSVVTVTYTENDITRSDTIAVSVSEATVSDTTYRALAIGVGDYIYYGEDGDLIAPPYDVIKVKELFYDCKFGNKNTSFTKISELKDTQATKTNIIQKIQSTFSGADTDDVSYFYFSGHGYTLNQTSYLCPTDFNGETDKAISVDELESALSSIPGKKVVLIDSCNSGGFIGKSISNNGSDEIINYLADFNESIINTFSNKPLSKDLLTSSEYQVLTSSHWYQESYEIQPIEGDPFGVFTQGLYEGCSLDNNIPADANQDDKISLQEAYEFISQWTASMRYNQNVQVYPLNSNFTIFEY
jgi:hypothetical protein